MIGNIDKKTIIFPFTLYQEHTHTCYDYTYGFHSYFVGYREK